MRISKSQKLSQKEKADFGELESSNPQDRVEAVLSEEIPWRTLLKAIKAESDPIVLNEFAIYSVKQYPSVHEAYITNDAVDITGIWLFLCNPKVKISRSVIEKVVAKAEKVENGLADVAHAIGLQESAWPELLENLINNYAHHSMETISNLLANPNMPPYILSRYQDSDQTRILMSLAYNTSIPDEVVRHLLGRDDVDKDVIEGIIFNPSVSELTLEDCAFSSVTVSDCLADNSSSMKVLTKLSEVEVDRIDENLLRNPSISVSILKKIAIRGKFPSEVFRHEKANTACFKLLDLEKVNPTEFKYLDPDKLTIELVTRILAMQNVESSMQIIRNEEYVSVEDILNLFDRIKGNEYTNLAQDAFYVKENLLYSHYPEVKRLALEKYGISLEEIPKEMVPDLLGWP
jgi:hypothetical protein